MTGRLATALFAAAALVAFVPQLCAQDTRRLPIDPSLDTARPAAGDRPIEVSVQYNFMVPVKGDSLDSQRESLEGGRRMIYEIAAGECKVLMATIATTCELVRINVNSNVQRHAPMQEMANIGANAAYRIQPKARK